MRCSLSLVLTLAAAPAIEAGITFRGLSPSDNCALGLDGKSLTSACDLVGDGSSLSTVAKNLEDLTTNFNNFKSTTETQLDAKQNAVKRPTHRSWNLTLALSTRTRRYSKYGGAAPGGGKCACWGIGEDIRCEGRAAAGGALAGTGSAWR
jgi:hypothetical protein